jgi:hypothetical protein
LYAVSALSSVGVASFFYLFILALANLNPRQVQVGLDKALDSSNIGNSMLKQMGWKDGSGLGRHGEVQLSCRVVLCRAYGSLPCCATAFA